MQLYLSDYLFYSFINSLYYPGIYIMNATIPGIDTTVLNIGLLGKMKKAGFDNGQPCIVRFNAIGEAPSIDISEAQGLEMHLGLAFDIQCKQHSTSTEYSQVFTINTNRVSFIGRVEI